LSEIYNDLILAHSMPLGAVHTNRIACRYVPTSLSKTIAPGYRIGWLATSRHMQRVLEDKLASTLCSPGSPQAALADFLSCGGYDSHLRMVIPSSAEATHGSISRRSTYYFKIVPLIQYRWR
jgi:aspartate/methionine/tyrosine aminotransferase